MDPGFGGHDRAGIAAASSITSRESLEFSEKVSIRADSGRDFDLGSSNPSSGGIGYPKSLDSV